MVESNRKRYKYKIIVNGKKRRKKSGIKIMPHRVVLTF